MPATMISSRRVFLAGAAASVAAPALLRFTPASAAGTATVKIRDGILVGERRNGALSFKGVPYADTTAGANRFKAPQPVKGWSGERDATRYGPLCPQIKAGMGVGGDTIFEWYDQPEPMGEDCCVLNVFTPDLETTARRPVLFYIHGGGYINGGGGGAGLNGSNLARYGDAVVVTINHRLNAFGYTTLSHVDRENLGDAANAGHLDILAALRWVSDNISAFGGDRDNVTVFGQSGGGSKIMILLAMPAAKGLFHKAISMSGAAGLNVDPAEAMEPYSNALLKELSIDRTNLSALQELAYEDLLKARSRAVAASGLEGARPVIDGRHIVTRPMSAEGLKAHANIPLMLGHTETEASLFFRDDMRNFTLTEAQMRTRMRKAFNIDDNTVGSIMDAYRKDAPGMTPSDILIATTSDVQFTLPLTQAARIKSGAEGQAPVYMYNFAWEIPWNGGVLGSPHAVDIPFAFGTVDAAGAMTGTGDGAIEASLNLMSAFVNFARTGNPNNSRLPDWQPYGSGSRTTMVIDTQCNAVNDRRGAALAAIANLKIDPFNRAALYRYGDD